MHRPNARIFLLILAFTLPTGALADNWPQFGAGRAGRFRGKESAAQMERCRERGLEDGDTRLGWSSPIVWGERIFMTYTSEDGVSCHVICLERKAGKFSGTANLHAEANAAANEEFLRHADAGDGWHSRLCGFQRGWIAAMTFDGKSRLDAPGLSVLQPARDGASPILYKDLLIIPYDTSATTGDPKMAAEAMGSLICSRTGQDQREGALENAPRTFADRPLHTARDDCRGQTQLISDAGDVLEGFDPETGRLICGRQTWAKAWCRRRSSAME